MIRSNPILSAGLVIVLAAASAVAETPAAEKDQQTEPRYRLAEPISPAGRTEQNGERHLTKEDFYWANLTAASPASGADPDIGNRNKHAFYDFRDGFDLPKYIAGPKVEIK